jgi:WD40 repeat protein
VKGFLFLIKTEDHFFDDYLVKKLIDTNLFASKGLKKDLSELNAFKNEAQTLNGCYLIEIPKITDEVMAHLSEQVIGQEKESTSKVVYLLPNQITRRFFDISGRESFISSCLFISELGTDFATEVLEERLITIFDKQLTPDLLNFFTANRQSKSMSLGKLLFFAQIFKNELIKGGFQTFDESSLAQFLDNIGAKFLSAASVQVSRENLQAFFRAFVFQQGTSAIPIELTQEEIQSFCQLPKEQLDFLLQLATSEQYQVLSERGGAYRLFIPEYSMEWKDLKSWVGNEEEAFKQYKVFEAIAQEYFKGTGFLLAKERLDQALILKEEIFTTYYWEVKYKVDKELFSSFLLLSQNFQEEFIKTQQKKRASLLRNSVRISIAVSIAFLLSSFTALLAYLERNSAVIQQELAIKSKEEAVVAQRQAEKERLEAVSARENEQSALKVAQEERLLAISAQKDAEVQRGNALESLNAAKIAEKEASDAKDVALKNAKLANDATIEAKINFEKSEKLRNQQEARATALEALGYFANRDFARAIDMVKGAYQKNLSNGGFPLQSDIFNALLNGLNSSKVAAMDMDLEFPAKLLALSKNKDRLAVYTINGELRLYATQPTLTENAVIKTGYIKSFEFLSDTQIIGTDIKGALFLIDLTTATISDLATKLPVSQIKGFFKAFGSANIWVAKQADGSTGFYQYEEAKGFISLKDDKSKLAGTELNKPVFWAEGNDFYRASLATGNPELVVKASSPIHSAAWSTTHSRWMLGLENGNIWSVDPTKQKTSESFTIHSSKVSQLVTMPYAHGTELMLSTGFDGGLIFFVFDKEIPLSASASSRVKFQGHRSWITGFTIDEKKKIAYSISNDRTIKVWPLEINELLQK